MEAPNLQRMIRLSHPRKKPQNLPWRDHLNLQWKDPPSHPWGHLLKSQVVIQALEDLQKITLQYSPVKELQKLKPSMMRRKLFVRTTVEQLLKRPWSSAKSHSPI